MAPTKKTADKKAPAQKTASKSTTAKKKKNTNVTEEQIRARAYEIYKASGSKEGLDREHWLQAEKELLNK